MSRNINKHLEGLFNVLEEKGAVVREPDYPHNYEGSTDGLCTWCGGEPGLTGNCAELEAEARYHAGMQQYER